MFGAAEEDPLKQSLHQAVTSPSILESQFRLYLIASAPGLVFLRSCPERPRPFCPHVSGVRACGRADMRPRAGMSGDSVAI